MTTLLWTFPLLMLAAIVIGWAAELTAVHLSAGMALAILAWLQTSPEFAVEATIAWNRDAHLALANLSGSLRLLLGFGWPMIFFIHWMTRKNKGASVPSITLPDAFAVEAAGLGMPVVYFLFIYFKGTWTALDGVVLVACYGFYFYLLNRQRKCVTSTDDKNHDDNDEPWVVAQVLKRSKTTQHLALFGMFAFGGVTLYFTAHPFIEALKAAASGFGVSEFVFIQWVAPIASEFPEKVTAFSWARRPGKVSLAVVNMLSSVTSQWTLLAGMVPLLFCLSAGQLYVIEFNAFQQHELLLTIAQSALAVVLLLDLKILAYEMVGFFVLWLTQFLWPSSRDFLVPVYGFWTVIELLRLLLPGEGGKQLAVPRVLMRVMRRG